MNRAQIAELEQVDGLTAVGRFVVADAMVAISKIANMAFAMMDSQLSGDERATAMRLVLKFQRQHFDRVESELFGGAL